MIATIASREEAAKMIAEALANYTGEIEVCKPCPINPTPPEPSGRIDPTTKLKRKPPAPPPKELSEAKLRQLATLSELRKVPKEERQQTQREIAIQHGISRSTLQYRLAKGMTMQEATAPTNPNLNRWAANKRNRKVLAQEWQA
jgi:hypothetical protein